jgi:hypothetical protein
MAEISQHGRLLASAAKSTLAPLGCKQIGRSRTWICDQGFWVVVVEFQPSGFSKGSYLNVGACWLWYAKNHWSFDYGGRVEGFIPFKDAHQFGPASDSLARRAAEEIGILRKKFTCLRDVARELALNSNRGDWSLYHAAVANGLVRELASSKRFFERLLETPPTTEWQTELRATAAKLAHSLPDYMKFQAIVLGIIQESRMFHRLPLDQNCLDTV